MTNREHLIVIFSIVGVTIDFGSIAGFIDYTLQITIAYSDVAWWRLITM